MYLSSQIFNCKMYRMCVSCLRIFICCFVYLLAFCHANFFFLAVLVYKDFRTKLRIKTCTFYFQCHVLQKLLKANNIHLSTRGKETAYGFKLPSYIYLTAVLQSGAKLPLASLIINKEKWIWCFYFS